MHVNISTSDKSNWADIKEKADELQLNVFCDAELEMLLKRWKATNGNLREVPIGRIRSDDSDKITKP
jgi:hypothetical protein